MGPTYFVYLESLIKHTDRQTAYVTLDVWAFNGVQELNNNNNNNNATYYHYE